MNLILSPFTVPRVSTTKQNSVGSIYILSLFAFATVQASATTLTFENFALAGGLVNVSPSTPYAESGFTLTPPTGSSAVFDSAAGSKMIGNNTDWLGFAENNLVSLTLTAGSGPFNLESLLLGPSTIGSGVPITMTITGNLFGGGTASAVFSGLTTATTEALNWVNLSSVSFHTTEDAGLDDVVLTVPEPSSLALLGMVSAIIATRRYLRHNKSGGVV